jgi:hypothetical protein
MIPQIQGKNILGGLRIIRCSRLSWLGCSLSKHSFLEIEDAFQLTPDTLPSLFAQNGTCSRRLIYDGDRIARVGMFHISLLNRHHRLSQR